MATITTDADAIAIQNLEAATNPAAIAARLGDVLVSLATLFHQEQGHVKDYGARSYLNCPHHACSNVRRQIASSGMDPEGGNHRNI